MAARSAKWGTVATAIEKLGGTSEPFNSVTATSPGYTLVGGPGIKAAHAAESRPETAQPARIKGILARSNTSQFEPWLYGRLGQFDQGIAPLMYQAPTPWPHSQTDGEKRALAYLPGRLGITADMYACYQPAAADVRATYCSSQSQANFTSWAATLEQLNGQPSPLPGVFPAGVAGRHPAATRRADRRQPGLGLLREREPGDDRRPSRCGARTDPPQHRGSERTEQVDGPPEFLAQRLDLWAIERRRRRRQEPLDRRHSPSARGSAAQQRRYLAQLGRHPSDDGYVEQRTIGRMQRERPSGNLHDLVNRRRKPLQGAGLEEAARLALKTGQRQPLAAPDDQLQAQLPSARPERREPTGQHSLHNHPRDREEQTEPVVTEQENDPAA